MSSQQELRDRLWNKMYEELLEFKDVHEHSSVPSTWHNKALAKWVSRQREKENTMVIERRQRLNAIGFKWHADMQQLAEEKWKRKYDQLISFYKEHHHHRIPSIDTKYHALRIWVDAQRSDEHTMPSHRKKLLNDIKFHWGHKITAQQSENWNAMFNELTLYHKKLGNSRVSCHSKNYPQLGKWVLRQRMNWEKLDKRKKNKLLGLDFDTSPEIDKERRVKWLTMLAVLKRYHKQHGNCRVPSKYKINQELGRWVEVQRLEEKKLSDWKKEKLSALGFEWSRDIRDNQQKRWYEMYTKLEKFYERFGHSSVPEYWKEDHKLAIWISYQRRPKSPLAQEKVILLNLLSFVWNPSKEKARVRNVAGQFTTEL